MRLVALSFIMMLLVPLSGCPKIGGLGGSASRPAAEPAVVLPPELGLSARERLLKAVGLLEVGEAAQAKVELLAYLAEEPKGKLANKLLPQIDADPRNFFQKAYGSESFLYKMRTGDSLSNVAQRFLGDPMLFHVLARYNGIQSPRELKAGKVIRIPGKPPADLEQTAVQTEPPAELPEPPATGSTDQDGQTVDDTPDRDKPVEQAEPPPDEEAPADGGQPAEGPAPVEPPVAAAPTDGESDVDTIQSMILEAQDMSAEGDFKAAAIHLEQGLKQFPDSDLIKGFAAANYLSFAEQLGAEGKLELSNVALERSAQLDPGKPEVKQRLTANYLALADQHIDAGRYGEALAALNKAEGIDPHNAEIKPRMARLARFSKANEMYTKGAELRDAGKIIPAYDAFMEALKIDPGHVGAEKERALLVPKVAGYNYGEGVKALSRQDLDKALGFFNKALDIDPSYTPAQRKRDQALELKKNLELIPTE